MPAADFSIRSTNIDEIPNAVTAKDTPVDNSLATFLGAMNKAAEGAVESWSAHRGQELYRDLEQEYRKNLGYTADPLGNEYPAPEQAMTAEEAVLSEKVDRLDQVKKTVGRTARAELMLEASVLEAQARDPFLADRYERIKNRLKGQYQQTVEILNAYDKELNEAEKEESKRLLARQKSLDTILRYSNTVPMDNNGNPISPYTIFDEQELAFWEAQGLASAARQRLIDNQIKLNAESRAQAGEGRAQRGEVRAIQSHSAAMSDRARSIGERNILQGMEVQFGASIEREVQKAIAAGALTNPAQGLQAMNSVRERVMREYDSFVARQTDGNGNPFPFDPGEVEASRQRLDARINSRLSLFNGDASFIQQNETLTKTVESMYGVNALEVAPLLVYMRETLPPGVWSNEVFLSSLGVKDTIRNTFQTALREQLGNLFSSAPTPQQEAVEKIETMAAVQTGQPVNPNRINTALTYAKGKIRDFNRMGSQATGSEAYGHLVKFNADQYDILSARDRVEVFNDVFSGEYNVQLEGLPNEMAKQQVAAHMYKIAIGQGNIIQQTYQPQLGNIQWNDVSGMVEGKTPADAAVAMEVNKVLAAVDVLNSVNQKVPSRSEVASSLFGLTVPDRQQEQPK